VTYTLGHSHIDAEIAPLYRVRPERNRQVLQGILNQDRGYAAFAIGHLDHGLFKDARYWTAEGPNGEQAIVMHANGGLGRITVIAGDTTGVEALLSLHPGPRSGYLATCAPEHLNVVNRVYALDGLLTMIRMSVDVSSFSPIGGSIRRLVGTDTEALNALYASGGGPTGYRSEHIEQGVYCGAFETGRLVAIGGTHLVAPASGIAVVGNVFTHSDWRGRGLATRVTSAVTAELFDRGCWQVALTVDPENTPAIRTYAKLGYMKGSPVHEVQFRRRDILGFGATLRRRFARRGNEDKERLIRVASRPEN
jgi:ribosomal protein S18 acetylase RimI-like enzyme